MTKRKTGNRRVSAKKGNAKNSLKNTIKNEILGILLVGAACLGFVFLYTDNGGIVGENLIHLIKIAVGEGSVFLFIMLAIFGIILMGKNSKVIAGRVTGILLLWLVLEGLFHLNISGVNDYNSAQLFEAAMKGLGGGLIGAGLSIVLVSAVGLSGSYVFLIITALVGAILAINRSLISTARDFGIVIKKGISTFFHQINEFIKVIAETNRDGNNQTKENVKTKQQNVNKRKTISNHNKKNIIDMYHDDEEDDLVIINTADQQGSTIDYQENNNQNNCFSQGKKEYNDNDKEKAKDILEKGVSSTPISRQTEKDANYKMPPLNLVQKGMKVKNQRLNKNLADNVKVLEETLLSFGVKVKVTRVTQGPAITRYELQPAPGVKVSKITSLSDDIALSLAASDVRIEAPIPGKSVVGIEVPNKEIALVHFREVLETEDFQESSGKMSLALGKDISGNPIIADLSRMPHLLIAGATGSGKSVCINTIIASIVYKARPDEVKLLLIDPKMVELTNYNGIPHLISPVVTDPQKAAGAIKWIVTEMETRYELFASTGVRDIIRYNYIQSENNVEDAKCLPYVVVIIDELADLMMVAPGEVEDGICRLAQMARAAGIHLIVATQRPSVDVITGLIKANIPSRIAFAVSSQIDSRTILDTGGAEKLLGRGDMLFHPMGMSKPVRVQGCFLADKEVKDVVDFLKKQAKPEYHEIPQITIEKSPKIEPQDELFYKAALLFIESNTASVSLLQRRLRIGYTRAARLMDFLEEKGVVGEYEGSKPREVLMTKGMFEQKCGKQDGNN